MLIVEPVLMAPLRRRWADVQARARELAARRDAANGARRPRLDAELFALLRGFRAELAATTVLDAACGSGNFLYVALRLLLDLEKEAINLAVSLGDTWPLPMVSPEQLHGIELNPYAHELAQVTVWIGYIQWLRENGFGVPSEPILKPLHNILLMDAILSYDAGGHPVEPEWPEACVIIGNPPFLGSRRLRSVLGDRYVNDLYALYRDPVPHGADLVCYWFERAREQLARGSTRRAGLLATQGIRGGASRKVLERIKETCGIFWAQSDRDWVLDGASVHVSMVGFGENAGGARLLNGKGVASINADLTASLDLTKAERLAENAGFAFQGPVKVGPFDIDSSLATMMLNQPNPHGASNAQVIKPWMNGADITRRPRRRFIIDFGELSMEEASLFEAPFEYVRAYVRPLREKNADRQRRTYWWHLGRSGGNLGSARRGLPRIVLSPRVSKHRLFVWADSAVLPDCEVVAIARDDDYFIGVLHSTSHELWARATGTQLREAESGFRYTPTTTFETYPFPWPPGKEPAEGQDALVRAIAGAARDLVAKRDAWLDPPGAGADELKRRTLTNLYNQRPTWLELAHKRLDEAVLDAYRWPHDLPDEEILERLVALNLQRAGQRGAERAP